MNLSINIFAMSDLEDRHRSASIIDFVHDPVPTGTDAPALNILQFAASNRPRVFLKSMDLGLNRVIFRGVQLGELLYNCWKDYEVVAHLRFRSRSILAMASAKGTAVSPEALASWYSRIASASSNSSRSFSYSSMLMTTAIFSPFLFFINWVGSVILSPLLEFTPLRPESGEPQETTDQERTNDLQSAHPPARLSVLRLSLFFDFHHLVDQFIGHLEQFLSFIFPSNDIGFPAVQQIQLGRRVVVVRPDRN